MRAVSDPRFKPRTFTFEPAAFGKARSIRWKPVENEQRAQLLSSKMQHYYAYEIQRAIRSSTYGTVKAYATEAGVEYQRFTKVLRGDAIMRLEDVALAYDILRLPLPYTDSAISSE